MYNVQITIWRESNVSNDQFSINEPVLFNVSCHCNRTVDRKDQDRQFFTGSSGGIFTGIVIGYFVTKWAHTVEEGQKYYSTAKRILSTGVVAQAFFTFFLLLFLVSIG